MDLTKFDLTDDDRARLEAITEATDPEDQAALLLEYYSDEDRVERTPRIAIIKHLKDAVRNMAWMAKQIAD